MFSKKIDIIIPVYNKSLFLYDLFDDLMTLSSKKFNIIFVDDGSQDDSYVIMHKLVEKYDLENFYVYTKENGGVSSARNYGIDLSISEYIWFIDPDDRIDRRFFEMQNTIDFFTEDIIVFNYSIKKVYDEISNDFEYGNYGIIRKNDFMISNDALLTKSINMNVVWNKFYKRECIDTLRFDENLNLGEDRAFNLNIFSKSGCVRVSDIFAYQYFMYSKGTLSSSIDYAAINNISKVNYMNIEKMNYSRKICKAHIVSQLKLKFLNEFSHHDILSFYKTEHEKLKIKILPFYSFVELIMISIALSRSKNFFLKLFFLFDRKKKKK